MCRCQRMSDSIAPDFDWKSSYKKDSVVMYYGLRYVALVDVAGGNKFDESQWKAQSVQEVLNGGGGGGGFHPHSASHEMGGDDEITADKIRMSDGSDVTVKEAIDDAQKSPFIDLGDEVYELVGELKVAEDTLFGTEG